MFRIEPATRESTSLHEVNFAQLGLRERRDNQEWVAAHPDILDDDLMIIAKEFSGFDRTSERPDLLAIDSTGNLVIIELKRDDSGADAYWQAVKYASYFRHANADKIAEMLADYASISQEEAGDRLLKHLDADDLDSVNREQRIILASHRFAPEATSAVLWLNEKFGGENLITCVQLTPYRDEAADALYLQANTIIPLPGEEEYIVQVGSKSIHVGSGSSLGEKLSRTFARNSSDEVTRFFRRVRNLVLPDVSPAVKPDRHSRWAGDSGYYRYYKFWYKRPPWMNWGFAFAAKLYSRDGDNGGWTASVGLEHWNAPSGLNDRIGTLSIHSEQEKSEYDTMVTHSSDDLNEDFAKTIATTFRQFIENVTPVVDAFMEEEANQEDA
jgi:hypothetical protein